MLKAVITDNLPLNSMKFFLYCDITYPAMRASVMTMNTNAGISFLIVFPKKLRVAYITFRKFFKATIAIGMLIHLVILCCRLPATFAMRELGMALPTIMSPI
jgi:hypothetical protein